MALDTDRLGKDAITRGAQAGVSHLAGIPGHGTMQVVRGQRHEVMGACGTWRPDDESRTSGCASPRFANTAPRSRAIRLSASAHRE